MEMGMSEGKAKTMLSIEGKRRELLHALGETPPLGAPMRVLSRETEERDGYALERLVLD